MFGDRMLEEMFVLHRFLNKVQPHDVNTCGFQYGIQLCKAV